MVVWNPSEPLNITTKTHEPPTALEHYPGKLGKPALSMVHVVSGFHLIMWFHNSCEMTSWNPSKPLNTNSKPHETPTALEHFPGKL